MENVSQLIDRINDVIVNPIIVLFFSLAGIVFFYGVVETLFSSSPDKRAQGSRHMIWGIIGMVIMVSVFGIMNLLVDTISSV